MYEKVDEIYKSNKLAFYQAYRESRLKEISLFQSFSVFKEERVNKIIGILEVAKASGNYNNVHHILKKGYRFTWNYVSVQRKIQFIPYVNSLYSKKQNKVPEYELRDNVFVALYLCDVLKMGEWMHIDNAMVTVFNWRQSIDNLFKSGIK